MSKYIMRLDDAATKMNIEKWERMELLLDKYEIKPLVGVIPDCKDLEMEQYTEDVTFWNKVHTWVDKGWTIALHGYNHVYCSNDGGINPVNRRSEFAGIPLNEQKKKIHEGIRIFRENGIESKVFFAPSHTFDLNTIEALRSESEIRIISDTVANKPYSKYGFTFVPQQSGRVRKLPLNVVTFCYHPNVMKEDDFEDLELFLSENQYRFSEFPVKCINNKRSFCDIILEKVYFLRRGNR